MEIGGRADESVPFVKRASLNALLQWESGLFKIQMFSALKGSVLASFCERAFYAEISLGLKTRTPPFPLEIEK